MKTVAILYGWSEGKWHKKKLVKALNKRGYEVINKPQQADFLICHSGGCFLVPKNAKAKKILFVGIPLKTHSVFNSAYHKIRLEELDFWWYRKTLHNIWYSFFRPIHNFKIWRDWKIQRLPKVLKGKVTVIESELDYFYDSSQLNSLAKKYSWKRVSRNSHHDEIWLKPEPYIDIMEDSALN